MDWFGWRLCGNCADSDGVDDGGGGMDLLLMVSGDDLAVADRSNGPHRFASEYDWRQLLWNAS